MLYTQKRAGILRHSDHTHTNELTMWDDGCAINNYHDLGNHSTVYMYVYIVTILHTSNVYNYMPVFLNKVKINNEKTSKFKTEKN